MFRVEWIDDADTALAEKGAQAVDDSGVGSEVETRLFSLVCEDIEEAWCLSRESMLRVYVESEERWCTQRGQAGQAEGNTSFVYRAHLTQIKSE